MTNEDRTLGLDLIQRALDGTDEPAAAVSVLMSSAATILQRTFGGEVAVDLMQHALDEAGAEWRRQHAN